MTKSKKPSNVEQEIRAAMDAAFTESNYLEGYAQQAHDSPAGYAQTHFTILAAYLTAFSLDKQEKIGITLRWHSWVMLLLTIVILAAVVVQICLAV